MNDAAGYSADGRLVCTRYGCQYVEEINRRVGEGTLKIVGAETYLLKPGEAVEPFYNTHSLDGIIVEPKPNEDEGKIG